jgi:hypothetical protein
MTAWIHHACSVGARDLSPLPWRCGRLRASLPATGRECTPFFTWQRPAPGRRALRRARDPGGPDGPLADRRQQWRGNAGRLKWLKVRSRGSGRPGAAREAKATDRDTNRRNAGAGRQPRGPPKVPGSPPQGGSRGGPAGSPGAGGQPAPGLPRGACVPVAPSQGAIRPRGGRRVARSARERRRRAARMSFSSVADRNSIVYL